MPAFSFSTCYTWQAFVSCCVMLCHVCLQSSHVYFCVFSISFNVPSSSSSFILWWCSSLLQIWVCVCGCVGVCVFFAHSLSLLPCSCSLGSDVGVLFQCFRVLSRSLCIFGCSPSVFLIVFVLFVHSLFSCRSPFFFRLYSLPPCWLLMFRWCLVGSPFLLCFMA